MLQNLINCTLEEQFKNLSSRLADNSCPELVANVKNLTQRFLEQKERLLFTINNSAKLSALIRSTTVIIPYRKSNDSNRELNLKAQLTWFTKNFPSLKIIVVEQDSCATLTGIETGIITHLFIYNPKSFNKSWALNVAVKNTTAENLIFADTDLITCAEGFGSTLLDLCKYDATKPYETGLYYLNDEDSVTLRQSVDVKVFKRRYDVKTLPTRLPFAGGLFCITRAGYEKVGGWDEQCESWGGEDDAFSIKIMRLLTYHCDHLTTYHLFHQPAERDVAGYQKNISVASMFLGLKGEDLLTYAKSNLEIIGKRDKYCQPVSLPFSKVLVINMEKEVERWREISEELTKNGIKEFTRFAAIRVDKPIDKLFRDFKTNSQHCAAIGCASSHLAIIKQAREQGLESILIFEDDAKFEDFYFKYAPEIKKFVAENEWHMFYLGVNHMGAPLVINSFITKVTFGYATHAYAVHSSFYDKYIEIVTEKLEDQPIDVSLAQVHKEHKIYAISPRLVYQRQGYSQIMNQVCCYDKFLRDKVT